jgi:hypothetical protein
MTEPIPTELGQYSNKYDLLKANLFLGTTPTKSCGKVEVQPGAFLT